MKTESGKAWQHGKPERDHVGDYKESEYGCQFCEHGEKNENPAIMFKYWCSEGCSEDDLCVQIDSLGIRYIACKKFKDNGRDDLP